MSISSLPLMPLPRPSIKRLSPIDFQTVRQKRRASAERQNERGGGGIKGGGEKEKEGGRRRESGGGKIEERRERYDGERGRKDRMIDCDPWDLTPEVIQRKNKFNFTRLESFPFSTARHFKLTNGTVASYLQ